jgi:hypothetical protein
MSERERRNLRIGLGVLGLLITFGVLKGKGWKAVGTAVSIATIVL